MYIVIVKSSVMATHASVTIFVKNYGRNVTNYQWRFNISYSSSLTSALDGQPGQYVLRHDERTGAFVEVRKALNADEKKSGSLDLHTPYNSVIAGEDQPDNKGGPAWSRLDFDVVLEWQKWRGAVPGMFKPKEPDMAPPGQNRGGSRGGRGFRGRGRGRGRGRPGAGGGGWSRGRFAPRDGSRDLDAPPSTKESDQKRE